MLQGSEPDWFEACLMPIHAWSKTDAGLFHHFQQRWIGNLCDGLNAGIMPADFLALVERVAAGPLLDELATGRVDRDSEPDKPGHHGGVQLSTAPPRTTFLRLAESDLYALKADRLAVRHRLGELVAVVEIVSPGNKSGKAAIRAFVDKAVQFLRQGVHLLIIDLFPPTRRDPQGLHPLIWDEFVEEPFELPAGRPLSLAAYSAGPLKMACVEPVAVGDALPEMPLFLMPGQYVSIPLEPSYQITWDACPAAFKEAVLEDAKK